MTMPVQKPSVSEQSVGTPWEFIRAVEARFCKIGIDLAASFENRKAQVFIDEESDSLSVDWSAASGDAWLNPPFRNIGPWAAKCASNRNPDHLIFMLTPASISSNWFRDHVHGHARVFALNPRMKFEGHKDVFPKDLILSVYGFDPGFEVWRWK